MFEDYPTKHEAQEQARNKTESFDRLIAPSDMEDGADSWAEVSDETLRYEAGESASIQVSEGQRGLHDLVKDRAFRIWTDGFTRVPDSVLNDTPIQELVHSYGIWPYRTDKWDIFEEAYKVYENPNHRMPQDCWDQAREEVSQAVFEELTDV